MGIGGNMDATGLPASWTVESWKTAKAAAVGVLRGCLWGQVGEEWSVLSSSVEKGAIWGHALWDQEK